MESFSWVTELAWPYKIGFFISILFVRMALVRNKRVRTYSEICLIYRTKWERLFPDDRLNFLIAVLGEKIRLARIHCAEVQRDGVECGGMAMDYAIERWSEEKGVFKKNHPLLMRATTSQMRTEFEKHLASYWHAMKFSGDWEMAWIQEDMDYLFRHARRLRRDGELETGLKSEAQSA